MRIRRACGVAVRLVDEPYSELRDILEGQMDRRSRGKWVSASPLTGKQIYLEARDLSILASLSESTWVSWSTLKEQSQVKKKYIFRLADAGLVVVEHGKDRHSILAGKDRLMRASGWSPFAALYHRLSEWRDIDVSPHDDSDFSGLATLSGGILKKHEKKFGAPPTPLYQRSDSLSQCSLPEIPLEGPLADLLGRRQTTRNFDTSKSLAVSSLSTVLGTCFGFKAAKMLGSRMTLLKKTSPSAGALHPIEVYPVVTRVDGLVPGIYHYNVGGHRLDLLEELSIAEAKELINEATAGQRYYEDAHCIFLLTARLNRNFWKYRENEKAYKAVLMDAAHVSQTVYLVCCDLELGAFFSAAINDSNINQRLNIDGMSEAAIAVSGCGIPLSPDPLGLDEMPDARNNEL